MSAFGFVIEMPEAILLQWLHTTALAKQTVLRIDMPTMTREEWPLLLAMTRSSWGIQERSLS